MIYNSNKLTEKIVFLNIYVYFDDFMIWNEATYAVVSTFKFRPSHKKFENRKPHTSLKMSLYILVILCVETRLQML
jgi:hypothetical protein